MEDEGIIFFIRFIFVEGGGVFYGIYMIFYIENIIIDVGGLIILEGLGYRFNYILVLYDRLLVYGLVNFGRLLSVEGVGVGGGYGGLGGYSGGFNSRFGFVYGNIYEFDRIGSFGGFGV